MAEQVRVSATVDTQGLEEAMSRFQRFSGTMSSAQHAMGQFERLVKRP